MTKEKVECLLAIEPVKSLKDVQHFLGFANFYRRFIEGYSKIVLPLTNSTKIEAKDWQTSTEIKAAQKNIVQAFTSAPILKHFDPKLQAIVETDGSDYALGAILSQKQEGRLHPVAFLLEEVHTSRNQL